MPTGNNNGNGGWLKLHRCLLQNPIWTDEVFTRGQAWVDLLLLAGHQERKSIVGCCHMIKLQPGQFVTSKIWLCKRWRWGKDKLAGFLSLLVSEGMLLVQTHKGFGGKGYSVFTVQNWNHFQGNGAGKLAVTAAEPVLTKKTAIRKPTEKPYNMPTSENEEKTNPPSTRHQPAMNKKEEECKDMQRDGFLSDHESYLDIIMNLSL